MIVTTGDDGTTNEFTAVTCRYVPMISESGVRVVALEIAFDPSNERPLAPYKCPNHRLERVLFSPRSVKRIRPYSPDLPMGASGPRPVETRVALAYADALDAVMQTHRLSTRSYFRAARDNIERGDRASIEPNVEILVKEVQRADARGLWAGTEVRDQLQQEVRRRLGRATPDEIAMAARLLAWFPGGDAPTYAAMWHTPLP